MSSSKVLVFDVETTGLFKRDGTTPLRDMPYILQISMVLYNSDKNKIERLYTNYIDVPESVVISDEVTNITGITREKCRRENGAVSIVEALQVFYQEYSAADVIVSHNMEFDGRMLLTEYERNKHDVRHTCHFWQYLFQPEKMGASKLLYCTMKTGRNITKLWERNHRGYYMKYPKLIELFRVLFPGEPEPSNLHNSLIDSLVCLRCFVFLVTKDDIVNPKIHCVKETNYTSLLLGVH